MKRAAQQGQSMTEYLVVLGVTGAALIAATSDVNTLFANVHDGYENQSREMSKLQSYNNPNLRFNPNPPGEELEDPSEELPPFDGKDQDGNTIPTAADLQLGFLETAYDAQGNQIGSVDGDRLLDNNGQVIGWCERNQLTGDCTFVDEDGNPLFPGATTIREFADDNKNPLAMMALTSTSGSNQGQVIGFVYLKNNKYYSAKDGRLLDPQPTQVEAKPTRNVYDFKDGKREIAGYELNGKMYSIADTLKPFGESRTPQPTELVTVNFVTAPSGKWQGYKPCLVMPSGWNTNLFNGLLLDAAYISKFNDPSLRLTSNSVGGFIHVEAIGCQGASSVTYNPQDQSWSLAK